MKDNTRISAKKEAARIRKQKSRQNQKSLNLVRLHVSLGTYDKVALMAIARHRGMTVSALVSGLIEPHVVDGRFCIPAEAGCLWESTEDDLDLLVSPEVHAHLTKYSPKITAGEIIEILLGLALSPMWDLCDEVLMGTVPGTDQEYRMMSHAEAHWRRGDRRWQQAMRMGVDREDCWPDRIDALVRARQQARQDLGRAHNTGDLSAERHEVKVLDEQFRTRPASWEDEPEWALPMAA